VIKIANGGQLKTFQKYRKINRTYRLLKTIQTAKIDGTRK